MKASISSLQIARAFGVSASMALGVKGGSSTMRASRCLGGSDVIGGAPPLGRRMRSRARRPARGEMLGIVGDGAHVLIARRQVDALEALGVRDRAFLPQLVPDREGVLDPVRVEVVPVGGPVRDGRTCALLHVCGLRSELDGKPARAAHGAFGPRHLAVEAELGNALQQLLHGHRHLHAREVGADAAVDAEAEGGMPVLLAVDDDLVGVREHRRVAAGGRETTAAPSRPA